MASLLSTLRPATQIPHRARFKVGDIVRFRGGSVDWEVVAEAPDPVFNFQRLELKSGMSERRAHVSSLRVELYMSAEEAKKYA